MQFLDDDSVLIADIYEAAGALRISGELIARMEGQTLARWHVMAAVSDAPLTVASAARRMGLTRQAVQRVANELVADELALFADNPDHRTSSLLELTPAGEELLTRIERRARASHERRFGHLSQDDLALTQRVLREIATETHRELRAEGGSGDRS